MIIRGTTPAMIFELPVDTDEISVGFVVVEQKRKTVIEKPVSDCKCEGRTLSVKFTQEETLLLSSDSNAEIKVVVKTRNGDRLETENPFIVRVVDTAKDGVI